MVIPSVIAIKAFAIGAYREKRRIQKLVKEREDLAEASTLYLGGLRQKRGLSIFRKLAIAGVTAAATVAAVDLIRQAYRMCRPQVEQGSLDPATENEIKIRNATVNPWVHVPIQRARPSTMVTNDVLSHVKKNLCFLTYGHGYCDMLWLKTGYILVPYHIFFLPNAAKEYDINGTPVDQLTITWTRAPIEKDGVYVNGSQGGTGEKSCLLFSSQAKRIGTYDLCIVHVAWGGVYYDITKLFSERDTVYTGPSQTVFRNVRGEIVSACSSVTKAPHNVSYDRASGKIEWSAVEVEKSNPWIAGDCGSITVTDSKDPRIIGFHLLGYGGILGRRGKSALLYKDILSDVMFDDGIPDLCEHSAFPETICGERTTVTMTVPQRCPLNWIGGPGRLLDYHGEMCPPSTYYTKLRPTSFAPIVEAHIGICNSRPPDFRCPWKPWNKYLTQVTLPIQGINPTLLQAAQDDYVAPLLTKCSEFPNEVGRWVRSLSNQEIINGIDGVKYIDSMNLNSGIGHPFSGSKRKHVQAVDPPLERPVDWKNPKIWEEMVIWEDKYSRKESCYPIFRAAMKDELLPIKKVAEGKVRIYQRCPLMLQCLMRKYFLPVARLIQFFPLLSECAVGINSSCKEWEQMHNHWIKFGEDRMIAGDYSKWDQRLPSELTIAAFNVLIRIAKSSGNYSDRDITIMESLVGDVVYPLLEIDGCLVRLFGSNPSGQNLTAVLNSISNSLWIRTGAYAVEGKLFRFRDFFSVMTYGDDIVAGVSPEITKFNFRTYKKYLGDLGMEFTFPDKEDHPDVDFLHIKESDFLKRKSVRVEQIDCIVGALNLRSILRPLYYKSRDSPLSDPQYFCAVADGIMAETFLHGESMYKSSVSNLAKIASDAQILAPNLDITFDQRVQMWLDTYSPSEVTHHDEPDRERDVSW